MHGTSQTVAITREPAGASCSPPCKGEKIGELSSTPGQVLITRSLVPVSVTCEKPGYQAATVVDHPAISPTNIGDIVRFPWSPITESVDAVSGAGESHDSPAHVHFASSP